MSAQRGWADETGSRHRGWQGWFTSRAPHPWPGVIETDSTPLSAKSGNPSQCVSHKCCGRTSDWCLAVADEDEMAVKIMGKKRMGNGKLTLYVQRHTDNRGCHSDAFCCFQNQDAVNLKFSFSCCQVVHSFRFIYLFFLSVFFFLPECALNISPLRTSAVCVDLGSILVSRPPSHGVISALALFGLILDRTVLRGFQKPGTHAGPTAASLLLDALLQKQPIRCFYFKNMWQCLHFLSTGTAAPSAFRSLCNDLSDLLTRIIYQQNKIISEFVGHQIRHGIQRAVLILYYIILIISPNIMLLFYNSCTCSVHVSIFYPDWVSTDFVLDLVCLSHDSVSVSVQLALTIIHSGTHIYIKIHLVVVWWLA